MALSPAASGWFHSELSVSAPFTMRASSTMAGSASSLYLWTTASNEHSGPWWPSSTPFTSYGVAPSRAATAMTWSAGTNRNSASWSTNFLMSHGHATRSTWTFALVTHFMMDSSVSLRRVDRGAQPQDDLRERAIRPEVNEIDLRRLADHVRMQRGRRDAVRGQRAQQGLHLVLEDREVSGRDGARGVDRLDVHRARVAER